MNSSVQAALHPCGILEPRALDSRVPGFLAHRREDFVSLRPLVLQQRYQKFTGTLGADGRRAGVHHNSAFPRVALVPRASASGISPQVVLTREKGKNDKLRIALVSEPSVYRAQP